MISDVFEFNREIVGVVQTGHKRVLTVDELTAIRYRIEEELQELEISQQNLDIIGSVDALLDLIYFALGAVYRLGLTPEETQACFEAIHFCNMRKKSGVVKKRFVKGVEDAVKPVDWEGPERKMHQILFGENDGKA